MWSRTFYLGQHHYPLPFNNGGSREGKCPFRFQNMWLKGEQFMELHASQDSSYETRGLAGYRLAWKPKALKELEALEQEGVWPNCY